MLGGHQRAKSMASGHLGTRNANPVMMRSERNPASIRKNLAVKGGIMGAKQPMGTSYTPAPQVAQSTGIGAQGAPPLKQLLAMK